MALISREDTIEAVNNLSDVFIDGKPPLKYATEVQDAINGLPAVDERKTGRWIMKPDVYGFFDEVPVCSECGCMTKMRETYNFCPNCGAKMEDEDETD